MDKLRQEFLSEAISSLESLQTELQAQEFFFDSTLQETFRRLHTIKGTSQTFGFNVAGTLAHEIENILQALRENKITHSKEVYSAINDGLVLVHNSLQNEQTNKLNTLPQEFITKIKRLIPQIEPKKDLESVPENIPKNLISNLSTREINSLTSALQNGNEFFLIEVGFDFADFDTNLRKLRESLIVHGEILATSPNPKVDASQQIGFQLFFVSQITSSEIVRIIAPFNAILAFESRHRNKDYANNLKGVLSQIADNGGKTAQSLGKTIDFITESDEISVSPKKLKTIYEILLHLTRNAVDHAIEFPQERFSAGKNSLGEINIGVSKTKNKIVLTVRDDGRGIDTKQVIKKAESRGLIFGDHVVTEKEALQIIFLHGFSTNENVSEISGRGIGLDIVKEVVDNTKGEIKIQTILGQGTTFEILLPQDN